MRKHVLRVSKKFRHRQAYSATEARQSINILDIETEVILLHSQPKKETQMSTDNICLVEN